ncbi:non-ribosomal peptide synthetase [Nocardia jinanensis]|uniref:non-ribosomal peptide synthetase n=1 Tax=Nocardia jinanensis TaxID=382504 RepID=UPI0016635F76|nr:non-ribosomal peptide synthetase [Nocardia jinanensis]
MSATQPVPLSAGQRGLWLAQQLNPDVPICEAQYIEIHGYLDVDLLRKVLIRAALEVQSGYLRLVEVGGEPHQLFDPSLEATGPVLDLRNEPDPMGAALRWMRRECTAPLDMTRDRLAASGLLQVGDRHYLMYSRIHHVALDGYAAMTMANRVAALYTAAVQDRTPEPSRAADLRTLYDADRSYRESKRFADDQAYWMSRLADIDDDETSLAAGYAPPCADSVVAVAELPAETVERIADSARALDASPAAVVIAAFGCYLARMTGREEVLVDIPVSGRTTAVLRRSGGVFVNVVPLPIAFGTGDTVRALVRRVQSDLVGALRHQRCGLADIRAATGDGRQRRFAGPLVNVMFFPQAIRFGSLTGEFHILSSGPVEDLLVNLYQTGVPPRTILHFMANPDLYTGPELSAHRDEFTEFLGAFAAAAPSAGIGQVHPDGIREAARSRRRRADLAFWRATLADLPVEPSLPMDRPRSAASSHRSDTHTSELDAELVAALEEVARRHGSSLFTVVHAALAVLLARTGGSSDIPVGTPSGGSGAAGFDDIVGTPVDTLVLRTEIDFDERFTDLLSRIGSIGRQAFAHADVPIDQLMEQFAPQRSPPEYAPFQVMLAFLHRARANLALPGLDVPAVGPSSDVSRCDLRLALSDGHDNGGMTATFTYVTDLFDAATIGALARRWIRILESVAADPMIVVATIDLLDPAEKADLLARSDPPPAPPATLADLLAAAVAHDPDATATVFDGQHTSYRELDECSNRLARALVRRGVGPEDIVAIGLPRSPESILATWAVAKSGAAFLPVDPTYPTQRITHITSDAQATLGLTTSSVRTQLPDAIDWLTLDELRDADSRPVADDERVRPSRVDDIAYVIYTSGSTGTPKGVAVPHRGLANLVADQRSRFRVGPGARVLHAASPSFDAAILEYLWAFATGAQLVIAPPTVYGGAELARILLRENVTHAALTPTALATVDPDGLADLGTVVVGGEAPAPALVSRWAPGRRFCNTYGPAEATIQTNASVRAVPGALVTIGGPIRGVGEVVLDPRLRPVPVGVVGELYVTGPGLARGYRNRMGATASRFVADPFAGPGQRMYRTGDLVRWLRSPEGDLTLDFVGRTDSQVKVRGFRIELGEVESVLLACPGVAHAAAAVHRSPATGDRLIGYVVLGSGAALDTSAILAFAGQRLAPHMVPATVVVLDALPVTANGKLDRAALPEPDFTPRAGSRPPATEIETVLARLFAEVLGLDEVGAHDSFFALGGDSIMAIDLVGRAAAVGVVFSVRDMFDHTTVAGLAEIAGQDSTAIPLPPELPGGGVGQVPPTPIMCWMFERGEFDSFCQWVMLTLPAGIDSTGIGATVAAVLDHHDMLRSRLRPDPAHASGWALEVEPEAAPVAELIRRVPVDAAPDSDTFTTIARAEAAAAAERLDPAAGIVLQLVWLDRPGQPGRLLVVAHHLTVDGVSWRILVPDLATAWAQLRTGQEPRLAPVGTSMRRWAHALHTATAEFGRLDRWRSTLAAAEPPLGARRLDPAVDVQATVATTEAALPTTVTREVLTTVPAAFHGTVDDILITGLAMALLRWRRRRGDTVLETLLTLEGHGRHDTVLPGADLTRTVGWFTISYPVRLDLSDIDIDDAYAAGPAAGAVIKSVKEQLRQIPDHGIGYGLSRYLDADTARVLGALPGPQVSFNYLGRFDTAPTASRDEGWMPVGAGGIQNPGTAAESALGVDAFVTDTPDGPVLGTTWGHPTGLLAPAEVGDLAQLWCDAVTALATHTSRPGAGGSTPSDLDLVDLDQDTIDRLERRYPALEDIWSLTPLQAGLLFHAQLADGALDAYTVQLCLELGGYVDADRLRRAVRALLGRHPNLRSAFVRDGAGDAVQVVPELVDVPLTRIDLAEREDPESALDEFMDADRHTRFDMTAPPLLRTALIGTGDRQYRLLLSMHHILIDGWSTPLLIRELLTLYACDSDPALPIAGRPYRDYLTWLKAQDRDAAETAWARAFDGVSEPSLLAPADRGRRNATAAREVRVRLSEDHTAALVAVAHEQEVTLNTLVQAAWGIVLANATGREDVVFGATVSGRPAHIAGIESMIGLFINTVPVRVRLDHRESLARLVQRIQTEQAALLDHHHLGLARIQQVAGPGAMFDTVAAFESYPVDWGGLSDLTDIDGMRILGVQGRDAAHYPLGLIVHRDFRLHLTFKYLPELFTSPEIDAIADRVLRVLGTLAEHIDLPLSHVQLLSPAERAALVPARGRRGAVMSVLPKMLTSALRPDAEAVVGDGVRLSYRELDETSNRWARVLIAAGTGPESPVAVVLPRSVDAVTAVWAVAKAGGAFVQIDPAHPPLRNATVLADSGAAVGLTLESYRDQLPDTVRWFALDSPSFAAAAAAAAASAVTDTERTAALRPRHPAYLIYTSGSTGTPKGVLVTHAGMANLAAVALERFGVTPASRVLAAAAPTFDVSIFEWLSAAVAGATLILAPARFGTGDGLAGLVRTERITHAALTPALLAATNPDGLETVILGGEPFPPDLAARWAPGRTVINCYGATETTVISCGDAPLSTVTGDPISMGGPVRGFTAVVLDQQLRPVPPGVVGELYLSGPGLARGYHRQPAMTATRFVSAPYGRPGTRMYRTGDLVAWTADRTLQFKGRSDRQLEIQGNRVEPGEIEAALGDHPDITHAAVTVHPGPDGAGRLVGYVVPAPHTTPDTAAIITYLASRLPTHMIPTAILVLDRIPLTSTGKLDYSALPPPDRRPARFRPPTTPLETTVCDAFTDILDIDRTGLDDIFFAVGGNSLTALRLVARLAESTGVDVPIQWVFTDPTPQSLVRRIEARRRGLDEGDPGGALAVLLPLRVAGTEPPLFCIHPTIGTAWGFSGLVQYLDPERPVHGLQSPALTEPNARFDTLGRLADRYIAEIRSVQPRGPYHLLGYSLGGTIAHEIAVQLRRAGDTVATLAMMDTRLVDAHSARVPIPTLGDVLTEFGVPTSRIPADLTVEAATDLLHRRDKLFTTLSPGDLEILYRGCTQLVELTRDHRPTLFDGDLLYFRAAPGDPDYGPSPCLAWKEYVTGTLTEHRISARHEQMTDPEALRAIALVLNAYSR